MPIQDYLDRALPQFEDAGMLPKGASADQAVAHVQQQLADQGIDQNDPRVPILLRHLHGAYVRRAESRGTIDPSISSNPQVQEAMGANNPTETGNRMLAVRQPGTLDNLGEAQAFGEAQPLLASMAGGLTRGGAGIRQIFSAPGGAAARMEAEAIQRGASVSPTQAKIGGTAGALAPLLDGPVGLPIMAGQAAFGTSSDIAGQGGGAGRQLIGGGIAGAGTMAVGKLFEAANAGLGNLISQKVAQGIVPQTAARIGANTAMGAASSPAFAAPEVAGLAATGYGHEAHEQIMGALTPEALATGALLGNVLAGHDPYRAALKLQETKAAADAQLTSDTTAVQAADARGVGAPRPPAEEQVASVQQAMDQDYARQRRANLTRELGALQGDAETPGRARRLERLQEMLAQLPEPPPSTAVRPEQIAKAPQPASDAAQQPAIEPASPEQLEQAKQAMDATAEALTRVDLPPAERAQLADTHRQYAAQVQALETQLAPPQAAPAQAPAPADIPEGVRRAQEAIGLIDAQLKQQDIAPADRIALESQKRAFQKLANPQQEPSNGQVQSNLPPDQEIRQRVQGDRQVNGQGAVQEAATQGQGAGPVAGGGSEPARQGQVSDDGGPIQAMERTAPSPMPRIVHAVDDTPLKPGEHIAGPGDGGPVVTPEHAAVAIAKAEATAKAADPAGKGLFARALQPLDNFNKVFRPQVRSDDALRTGDFIRQLTATGDAWKQQVQYALQAARSALGQLPMDDRVQFVDNFENGRKQATPALDKIASISDQMLEARRQAIDQEIQKRNDRDIAAGKTDKVSGMKIWMENYFPHMWKDPARAENFIQDYMSRRPLEGSKAFTKKRTYELYRDAIKAGLEPVSDNPMDLVLLKCREMDKFILAHRMVDYLDEKGLLRTVKDERAPEGYALLKDKVFKGAYAPEAVAQVINNHLSPGLRGNALYDATANVGNALNQAQLGLSFFHLGFTSYDAAVSKLAIATRYLVNNKDPIKFLQAMKGIPLAPLTSAIEGGKIWQALKDPNQQGPAKDNAGVTDEHRKIASMLPQGGGRVGLDPMYQTNATNKMTEAFKKGTLSGMAQGAWHSPFAGLELAAKPIMEWWVPRQKLGIYADMCRQEMARPGFQRLSADEQRATLRKCWDSVDNRLGQLVYDNLFWNRTAKDAMMLGVRSVGWNLGTVRELGGGIKDTGAAAYKGVTGKGAEAEFTHRMAYCVALAAMTAVTGAVLHRWMSGRAPEDVRDLIFPSTGEKDAQGREIRLCLPSYAKDTWHYAIDPMGTVESKIHPMITMAIEMITNKDFMGRQIRDPNAGVGEQALEVGKHLGSNLIPLGIKQLVAPRADAQTWERVGNFFGLTRAPTSGSETPAERLAAQYMQKANEAFAAGKPQTPQAIMDRNQHILYQLRSPDTKGEGLASLRQLVQSGDMTPKQAQSIVTHSQQSFLTHAVAHASIDELLNVYNQASDKEKAELDPIIQKHVMGSQAPPAQKQAWVARYREMRQ